MHDGGAVIRIGGIHQKAKGKAIHDINNGTRSLNLGVTIKDAQGSDSESGAGFTAERKQMAFLTKVSTWRRQPA